MATELEISWLQNYTVSLSLALDFCIRLILSFPWKNSTGIFLKYSKFFEWLFNFKKMQSFLAGKTVYPRIWSSHPNPMLNEVLTVFSSDVMEISQPKVFWRKRHRKTFFRILVVLFYRVIDCYAVCKHESLFSSLVFVSITQKWKKKNWKFKWKTELGQPVEKPLLVKALTKKFFTPIQMQLYPKGAY